MRIVTGIVICLTASSVDGVAMDGLCNNVTPGAAAEGCHREWTHREAATHCGESHRPCAIVMYNSVAADECGKCYEVRYQSRSILTKVVSVEAGSAPEGANVDFGMTNSAFDKLLVGWEPPVGQCGPNEVWSLEVAEVDCGVEVKCREFVRDEPGTCNCATRESDFDSCGATDETPCVVSMEDAGPIGINQCNECYKLELGDSSEVHVRVVDAFDPDVEKDDFWRMQATPYLYNRIAAARPSRMLRGSWPDPETSSTCTPDAPGIRVNYSTYRCYADENQTCPQIQELTTTSTTTEESTTTSTTTEEPTTTSTTTEEPTTTSTTTEEPTTTSTTTEEPTTTS
eukprot:Polyplicarium_translucidae@DN3365_c0_g1_i13.p1